MIKYLYTLLVGALVLNSSAFADASAPNDDLEKELAYLAAERQVVVTASKMEEHVDKTIATTTVITQDDIAHIGARNLLDVLRLVPGIGITQNQIGLREIEVRGVKTSLSEKVQIMLNGHPLDHNLQNAGSAWVYDDLPVDTIKRVEVVRGPGSALYGANAFLAVINIITQNAKDLNGLHTSAGWGSSIPSNIGHPGASNFIIAPKRRCILILPIPTVLIRQFPPIVRAYKVSIPLRPVKANSLRVVMTWNGS